MKRFCVKCGKETSELVKSLCTGCFLASEKVIDFPEKIQIDQDKRTGKIRLGVKWVEKTSPVIEELLIEKLLKLAKPRKLFVENVNVSLAFDPAANPDERELGATISFEAKINDVLLPVSLATKIVFNKTISDSSMKILSNYHEAIIQIRFSEKTALKEQQGKANEVLAVLGEQSKTNPLSEAVDVKRQRGGYDILVASNKAAKTAARKISEKHNAEMIFSSKLIGQDKKGKEKYRHTYCVRF